jgi:phosphatidate cytidylyltransferase
MLVARLLLGTLFIAALVGMCWLDFHAARPGALLLPLAAVLGVLAAGELMAMFRKRGHQPGWAAIYGGVLVTILAAGMPVLAPAWTNGHSVNGIEWLALGLAAALLITMVGALRRFSQPGTATTDLAITSFAVLYVGGLIGFMVQLRLLSGGAWGSHGRWGMLALVSLIATVKMSDIGQYTIGRLIGQHKLAPVISPGKTWEGAAGGIVFAIAAAWTVFHWGKDWIVGTTAGPGTTIATTRSFAVIGFAIVVAAAGMLGDLAESMLKRDAGVKDSSEWMPGFGGVLDLLDSLLVAAPAAYLCWAMGWVGP